MTKYEKIMVFLTLLKVLVGAAAITLASGQINFNAVKCEVSNGR